MASSSPSSAGFCHKFNTIVQTAFQAAKRNDYHGLLENLGVVRRKVREPGVLYVALKNNQLSDLIQCCLSNAKLDVRKAALDVFLSGLVGLQDQELTLKEEEMARVVFGAIETHVLNVAVRSDLFRQAFDGLALWCWVGKSHRDLFLEAFPIEQLSRYDIFNYVSYVLNSYCCLVGTILEQGRGRVPLFGPVLEIYQKVLSCSESKCYYPKILSKSIRGSLEEFESENPIEKVISSSFINLVVRHAMSQETCKGYCCPAIMELIAECLAGCNNKCQRLVDQGILNLIGVCFSRHGFQTDKHVCSALAIVFASSLENIDNALQKNLVGPLFALRDCPQEGIDEEARKALLQLFARATPRQIFTLFEQDHCKAIVNLLDSVETSVQFDALRWLFALVSATRVHAPHELPKLRQRMLELRVKKTCETLIDCEVTGVSSLAQGLLNLMITDLEKQL